MKVKLNKIKKKLNELGVTRYAYEEHKEENLLVIIMSDITIDIRSSEKIIVVEIFDNYSLALLDYDCEHTQKEVISWLIYRGYLWQK